MGRAPELTRVLEARPPGRALDLACGKGELATWLAARGWSVTAVDLLPAQIPAVRFVQADLSLGEFNIEPGAWDLVVCWLYWQPDLLPAIRAGVRRSGVVALAGKTTGRFATSLARMRAPSGGWREMASGENEVRAFLIEEAVD